MFSVCGAACISKTGYSAQQPLPFFPRYMTCTQPYATLHGWVHVVVGDLFMARWAYLDGVEQNAPGWMLALISLMIGFVGPLGVITYVLIRPRFAQAKQK